MGAEKGRGGSTCCRHVLIVADIEGSSLCRRYAASSFLTAEWAVACAGMSDDVNAVIVALFNAGVRKITVKDFHRTGFNLLPERLDERARLVSGYSTGPVPGIGDVEDADVVLFLGMHAASGTDGFLPHTFTSRIRRLLVNGRLTPEVMLFSASLAGAGVRPVFFSGCPVACRQAEDAVPGIRTFPIDKFKNGFDVRQWRRDLAHAAVAAVCNDKTRMLHMKGPIRAVVTFREGRTEARHLARRWRLKSRGADVMIDAEDFDEFYHTLIYLCYLTPGILRFLPAALPVYHAIGRFGRWWVRKKLAETG